MIKKILTLVAAATVLYGCTNTNSFSNETDYTQYVNPFIGTINNGHTFPGATYPFGLIQASPETGNCNWRYCSGYEYPDTKLFGFSQTHLNGTGVTDLGDVLLLPFSGEGIVREARFDKATEKATPGYYAVELPDYRVLAEMTVTPHTAIHRYTYKNGEPRLLLDLQQDWWVVKMRYTVMC